MLRATAYGLALALGWLALMAGGMFIPGAAPAALVILPDRDFLRHLPDPAQVAARSQQTVVVSGATAGQLYRAGAVLVLPTGLPPCIAPR